MKERELINKFIAGEITDSEMSHLKSLLEKDPELRTVFDQENELWQVSDVHAMLFYFKPNPAWKKVSSKLGIKKNVKSVAVLNIRRYKIVLLAACVACLLIIGGLSFQLVQKLNFSREPNYSTIIACRVGEKSSIYLPDSTHVLLNSNGSLKFNKNYNIKDREVELSGEAFFDVHSDHRKPFVVNIDKMKIVATGTRFNVSCYEDDNRIETTLEKGQIYVSLVEGKKTVILKEGQQVVYFRNSGKILTRDVFSDTYTAWKEDELRFVDIPIDEIVRILSRKFNVEIEFENKELKDLKFTASFRNETIAEIFQMLKAISPIDYKVYRISSVNDKSLIRQKIIISKKEASVHNQIRSNPN